MWNNALKLAQQLSELWKILASVIWAVAEASSQRTCTSRQVGSHRIVGTCGTHISDTMKDGHPTLFAEGPEGSLLPLVPVKDVCASLVGIDVLKRKFETQCRILLQMPHLVRNTCQRWKVSGGKVVCSSWKLSEMSPTQVKGLEEKPAAKPWPPVLFPKRPK